MFTKGGKFVAFNLLLWLTFCSVSAKVENEKHDLETNSSGDGGNFAVKSFKRSSASNDEFGDVKRLDDENFEKKELFKTSNDVNDVKSEIKFVIGSNEVNDKKDKVKLVIISDAENDGNEEVKLTTKSDEVNIESEEIKLTTKYDAVNDEPKEVKLTTKSDSMNDEPKEARLATKSDTMNDEPEEVMLTTKPDTMNDENVAFKFTAKSAAMNYKTEETKLATKSVVVIDENDEVMSATKFDEKNDESEEVKLTTKFDEKNYETKDVKLTTKSDEMNDESEIVKLATKFNAINDKSEEVNLNTKSNAMNDEPELVKLATKSDAVNDESQEFKLSTKSVALNDENEAFKFTAKSDTIIDKTEDVTLATKYNTVNDENAEVNLSTETYPVNYVNEEGRFATKSDAVNNENDKLKFATKSNEMNDKNEDVKLATKSVAVTDETEVVKLTTKSNAVNNETEEVELAKKSNAMNDENKEVKLATKSVALSYENDTIKLATKSNVLNIVNDEAKLATKNDKVNDENDDAKFATKSDAVYDDIEEEEFAKNSFAVKNKNVDVKLATKSDIVNNENDDLNLAIKYYTKNDENDDVNLVKRSDAVNFVKREVNTDKISVALNDYDDDDDDDDDDDYDDDGIVNSVKREVQSDITRDETSELMKKEGEVFTNGEERESPVDDTVVLEKEEKEISGKKISSLKKKSVSYSIQRSDEQPVFSIRPLDKQVRAGEPETLRCSVKNVGHGLTVRWSKCGRLLGTRQALEDHPRYYMPERKGRPEKFDLVILKAAWWDQATFACNIVRAGNIIGSAEAKVDIIVPPAPVVTFSDGYREVKYNGKRPISFEEDHDQTFQLNCAGHIEVARKKELVVAWYLDRKLVGAVAKNQVLKTDPLCNDKREMFVTTQKLTLARSRSQHDLQYICDVRHVDQATEVQDYVGSFNVKVQVEFPPAELIMKDDREGKWKAGRGAQITCTGRYSNPAVAIHWYMDGRDIINTDKISTQSFGPYTYKGYESESTLDIRMDKAMNGVNVTCAVLHRDGAVQMRNSTTLAVTWIGYGKPCDFEGCGTGMSCITSRCGCDEGLVYDEKEDICYVKAVGVDLRASSLHMWTISIFAYWVY